MEHGGTNSRLRIKGTFSFVVCTTK